MPKNRIRVQIPTLLIALGLVGAVHAATFNVTNGTELQAALTTAQNNGEADTIVLAAGSYNVPGGHFSYPADFTMPAENFSLTLKGAGAETTFLEGDGTHLIFSINNAPAFNNVSNADVTIQDMTFQNGFGALQVFTNDADITLKNCDFLSNIRDDAVPGAVELQTGEFGGSGNILVDGNNFIHNISKFDTGAAFFISRAGSTIATNNVFFDNHTGGGHGGAVKLFQLTEQPLQFINNTVVGNSTLSNNTGQGGGVFIFYTQPTQRIDLYNNIIFNNIAGEAGKDVFVADVNPGTGNPALGTVNLFNNDLSEICFRSSGGCDPAAITGLSQGGEINVDPQLIDPTNGNFNLAAGSPAIDAGDSNAPTLPATDHDGSPRVIGAAPDMGALEAPLPGVGGGSGGDGNGGSSGDAIAGSGCALQGGTPAAWSGLLASLLLLPLGILRSCRRA